MGLAQAAAKAGVSIHDCTEVTELEKGHAVKVRLVDGAVNANHVFLACNGYLGDLNPKVAARVMPLNNFIAATEPLGVDATPVLTREVAVGDTKFVVN